MMQPYEDKRPHPVAPQERHVFVTGGGTGVGAEIAQSFAREGFKVTIAGRSEGSLKAQNLPYQICDVSERDAVEKAIADARHINGPLDIVIANAGAAHSVPFAQMTVADLDAMIAVNLNGVFNVWQAALHDMKASGWGRMIAVASTAGLKGYPYVAGYCAAKHGVVGLTKALAVELAQTGITVNAICPGFVETPLLARSIDKIMEKTGMNEEKARAALMSSNPQKRFIQPQEVAQAALWLASAGAASVNGHCLALSGGEI